MYKDILNSTSHREYPLPKDSWIMMQKWENVLFVHLPVPKQVIEAHLPSGLQLDTYGGDAWISIIPFKVSKIRPRKMPQIPGIRSTLEVNVRTYVKRNGISGVYFFSLDANKLYAVLGARMMTLPYYYATMSLKKIDEIFHYYSSRRGNEPIVFKASYQPIGESIYPEKNSLTYWLLERYFLFSYRNGSMYRGAIHHKQWEIQNAKVDLKKQSLTPFLPNNAFGANPLMHYAPSKVALIWMMKKL
ncbi:YqjF family protein [Virgibacillus ndiopensis]|uniref:YqjF family protein n=1 Tax=Virgibacillus ndiopensis TaxID=2004408 RepID=UPI000C070D73|nr:DUF2071 domain-containing protein [Virgibacillus ndiopensis]